MHTHSLEAWKQPHNFLQDTSRKERRVLGVVGLTACMMVAEIVSGTLFGSMALLADGWHMATHVSALLVSYFTYMFARKKADSPFFSFGTGKVGALGGFASAIGLGLVALLMGFESIERLLNPVAVSFKEALFGRCAHIGDGPHRAASRSVLRLGLDGRGDGAGRRLSNLPLVVRAAHSNGGHLVGFHPG